MLFNTAQVMSKGQITLPVDIRKKLRLDTGDRVALIYDDERVVMMNPLVHAVDEFQKIMEGEWEKAGIHSQEDLDAIVKEIRAEVVAEYEGSH